MIVERDDDFPAKRYALMGLMRTRDQAALPALLSGLELADSACRYHAILGVKFLRARSAVPRLIELLDDWHSGSAAGDALVEIRDERALAALRARARRGLPRSRRAFRERATTLAQSLGYDTTS
jgi:hypothetical protein